MTYSSTWGNRHFSPYLCGYSGRLATVCFRIWGCILLKKFSNELSLFKGLSQEQTGHSAFGIFPFLGCEKGANFLGFKEKSSWWLIHNSAIFVGIMKSLGSWVLFLVTLVAFICFAFSTEGSVTSLRTGLVVLQDGSDKTVTIKIRKLKEYTASTNKDESEHVELEDYRPIDPVPSSKTSTRPGPIQHGTPLMPYIPKPSPPPGL